MKHFTGVRRLAGTETRSLQVNSAMPLGQAVGYSAGNQLVAVVGAGRNFVGHLQQHVTADGVTTAYHFPGLSEEYTDIPAKVGDFVDVEVFEEFEAEGPHLTLTGTGGFDAASNGDLLALHTDGKWRKAQTGDTAVARLIRKDLTVQDAGIASNVRALIALLKGIEVV